MAILAIIGATFEKRFPNAFIFNALQASKIPAHSCAEETRMDQHFPSGRLHAAGVAGAPSPAALGANRSESGYPSRAGCKYRRNPHVTL